MQKLLFTPARVVTYLQRSLGLSNSILPTSHEGYSSSWPQKQAVTGASAEDCFRVRFYVAFISLPFIVSWCGLAVRRQAVKGMASVRLPSLILLSL